MPSRSLFALFGIAVAVAIGFGFTIIGSLAELVAVLALGALVFRGVVNVRRQAR